MIKNISLILVFILIVNSLSHSQVLHSQCSIDKENNKIEVKLKNMTKVNLLVQITNWEFDGMKSVKDNIIGFPNDSYIVNIINYIPNELFNKSISTWGDKGDYPDYRFFPILLKIKPNEEIVLKIGISKDIWEIMGTGKHFLSFSIPYCTEKQLKTITKNSKVNFNNVITKNNSVDINVNSAKSLLKLKESDEKMMNNFSSLFRSIFTKKYEFTYSNF